MRLNKFCGQCKHKENDKNDSEPCSRCAGTHIYSNYLFFEPENYVDYLSMEVIKAYTTCFNVSEQDEMKRKLLRMVEAAMYKAEI